MKKKIKKIKKREYNWSLIIFSIGFIILLFKGSLITYDHYRLSKYGQEKKAIITSKIWVDLNYRVDDGFFYYFEINESFFEGHTFDQEYQPGDSIIVLYLKDNPKINASLYELKRFYPSWFNKYIKK